MCLKRTPLAEVKGSQAAGAKTYRAVRKRGKSKNGRGDVPQVMVGLAVTRDGFPVRHWVFPGNTVDVTTVARVKADLKGWRLNRCVFVGDAGMVSAENLRTLARGGGRYIRLTPTGRPVIHRAKVKAAERLDGKFVVHSNDDTLSAEDMALGYKQLQRVEQAWRQLKSGLRLRPVSAPHPRPYRVDGDRVVARARGRTRVRGDVAQHSRRSEGDTACAIDRVERDVVAGDEAASERI